MKRVEGGGLLGRRAQEPAGEGGDGGAGDLDHVPELGLSEDVFQDAGTAADQTSA